MLFSICKVNQVESGLMPLPVGKEKVLSDNDANHLPCMYKDFSFIFLQGKQIQQARPIICQFFFRVKRGWALDFLARERGGWRYKAKLAQKKHF